MMKLLMNTNFPSVGRALGRKGVVWGVLSAVTLLQGAAFAATGDITTIAGNGTTTANNGAAATAGGLIFPSGVATDTNGNYFIAEPSNSPPSHRVRKVNSSAIINAFAGGTTPGFSGGAATSALLAFPNGVCTDAAGNVYIADSGNNRIRKVDTSGIITTVAGNGTSVVLASPSGVAIDTSGRYE
jgi:hypothetical protein